MYGYKLKKIFGLKECVSLDGRHLGNVDFKKWNWHLLLLNWNKHILYTSHYLIFSTLKTNLLKHNICDISLAIKTSTKGRKCIRKIASLCINKVIYISFIEIIETCLQWSYVKRWQKAKEKIRKSKSYRHQWRDQRDTTSHLGILTTDVRYWNHDSMSRVALMSWVHRSQRLIEGESDLYFAIWLQYFTLCRCYRLGTSKSGYFRALHCTIKHRMSLAWS